MRIRRLAPYVILLALLLTSASAGAVGGHGGPIKGIAISPDGKLALTGSFDYTVILWDLRTVTPLRRLVGHDAAVDAVAFLPGDLW